MRPIAGAARVPSGPSRTSGAYGTGVRNRASLESSLRRSHHARLTPALAGALNVRTVWPPASAIPMVALSVCAVLSQ